ncbi:PAS domain-containing protein [Candidatus Lokiarchaeum ossiferum]|uniref:PAS domain-containing protein n=1 Tax=Candidatus Lokiarchaeum ossiferum TaxID=2951803 RepID=UPI00352E9883
MYYEQLQFILVIPKVIESLLWIFNIILGFQKFKGIAWKDRPLVERLYLMGMIGWFVYITLDIFIFLVAPVSMEFAFVGEYGGYSTVYFSLFVSNLLRDVAFCGALVMLWAFLYASLMIWLGETTAMELFQKKWVGNIIGIISLLIILFDQITVKITSNGPNVNADSSWLGGGVLFLFILIFIISISILIYSLQHETNAWTSNHLKPHIRYLILGLALMGLGNMYWAILGGLRTLTPSLFRDFRVSSLLTAIGHVFWIISPIFLNFGIRGPLEVSPKVDEDYSKIGERNFQRLINQEIVGTYLIKEGKVISTNTLMEKTLGFRKSEFAEWTEDRLKAQIHPEDLLKVESQFTLEKHLEGSENFYQFRFITKAKEVIWVEQITYPIVNYDIPVFQHIFIDITRQKTMEAEQKVLRGMLPICAQCKKIRDDQGYYIQLEHYIKEHSEANFTHGICPECMEELLKEIE